MRLLTLHKLRQQGLWDHPNKVWLLVIVCECAHHRLSSLVKEPLYGNTGSGHPWTGLEKLLLVVWQGAMPPLPLSGSPTSARKKHVGAMEWDSSPVHLTSTITACMDFGMCHRFVRSVIIEVFLPGVSLGAQSFAFCLWLSPPQLHYKQLHFLNRGFYIFVFRCFVRGHAYRLRAPCDTEQRLTKTQLTLGHIVQALWDGFSLKTVFPKYNHLLPQWVKIKQNKQLLWFHQKWMYSFLITVETNWWSSVIISGLSWSTV